MNNKKYTYDEIFPLSQEYFNGDVLAASVWIKKYAVKDSDGNFYERTPDDMHHRIAKEFARIEAKYPNPLSEDEIYDAIRNFRYIVPAGSPMAGIGNEFQKYVSLSNCFVVGTDADSYNGIHYIDHQLSAIMKKRGGVGFDISFLRPRGTKVDNAALQSTGMASFMERFSNTTREVAQENRRGALLMSTSIKHTDAEQFIDSKTVAGKVTGANISVRIDDEFMKAVENDSEYQQQFPVDAKEPLYQKTIKARNLWNKIIHNAWASAEPGVLFWDTILRESVPDCYADCGFKTTSTNPCGEIPLSNYDSCRLFAINLYNFVNEPFIDKSSFDFDKFKHYVSIAMRLMDDLVDLELEKVDNILAKINADSDPEEIKSLERNIWLKIKEMGTKGRRTGLGITAEGDMLAALGYTYGTEEATDFAVKVQKTLALTAYNTSVILAKERGAFPVYDWNKEVNNPFINRLFNDDQNLMEMMKKYGRRNIACLTIAPTGSVSLMTQTTSGIEPVFLPVYKRRRKINPNDTNVHVDFVDETGDAFEEYIVFHPKFKTWMTIAGFDTEKKYTQSEIEELVSKSPYYKATANDVDWKEKVRMQGEIQKYVDHSISVTVNLPNSATESLVDELYMTAWKVGCKGLTIYRDGCRAGVLTSVSDKKKEDKKKDSKAVIEDRPKVLQADVIRFKNNKENWIAFVGKLDTGEPYEIFTGLIDNEEGLFEIPKSVTSGYIIKNILEDGTKSYDFEFSNKRGNKIIVEGLNAKFNPEFWNYSKLLSSVLRYNMPINYVLHLVDSLDIKEDSINSWKSGIRRALKRYVKDGEKVVGGEKCPECGAELHYQDGCVLCLNCGYSRCG